MKILRNASSAEGEYWFNRLSESGELTIAWDAGNHFNSIQLRVGVSGPSCLILTTSLTCLSRSSLDHHEARR